jgi:hypothetical protein
MEKVLLLLLLPVFFGPGFFWAARAAARRSTAAGTASHPWEFALGALLLVPYGAGLAFLGGRMSGLLAEPTVLGVSFAVLFGCMIMIIGLLLCVLLFVPGGGARKR